MDYPYSECLKAFQKNENIKIIDTIYNKLIKMNLSNELFYEYTFEKGTLYKARVCKEHATYRKALKTYESCIDYFLATGATLIDTVGCGREYRIIAIRNGKVYQLEISNTDVYLSCKWVNLAPPETLEWPDELELNEPIENGE